MLRLSFILYALAALVAFYGVGLIITFAGGFWLGGKAEVEETCGRYLMRRRDVDRS